MIVNLNKIYIMSAPPETVGMTPGDTFVESHSVDVTYVKMKKIHVATEDMPVRSAAKVFDNRGTPMQGVIFYTDLPEDEAKKRLSDAVQRLLDNAKEGNKPK